MNRPTLFSIFTLVLMLGQGPIAAQNQPNTPPHPRDCLERGAFEEEHERNFEKALKYYEMAETIARAMSDHSLVTQAAAARQRVLGIISETKAAAGQVAQDAEALERRLYPLFRELGLAIDQSKAIAETHPKHWKKQRLVDEIVVQGDVIVPYLTQALRGRGLEFKTYDRGAGVRLPLPPSDAAHLLRRLGSDAATAAIRDSLNVPDSFLQSEIISNLDPVVFQAELHRLADDPVERVAVAAVERLATRGHETPNEILIKGVKLGSMPCASLLRTRAPEELLRIIKESKLSEVVRVKIISTFLVPATADSVIQALSFVSEDWALEILDNPLEIDLDIHPSPTTLGNLTPEERRTIEGQLLKLFRKALHSSPPRLDVIGKLRRLWKRSAGPATLRLLCEGARIASSANWASLAMELGPEIISHAIPGDEEQLLEALAEEAQAPLIAGSLAQQFPMHLASVWDPKIVDASRIAAYWQRYERLRDALARVILSKYEPNLLFSPVYAGSFEVISSDKILLGKLLLHAEAIRDESLLVELYSRSIKRTLDHSGDPRASESLLRLLAKHYPERAIGVYKESAPHLDARKQLSLLPLIQELPLASQASVFASLLGKFDEKNDRESALRWASEGLRGPGSLDWLIQHIPSSSKSTQVKKLLERIGNELHTGGVPYIGECLKSPSHDVREAAVVAMSKLKAAREALADFESWTKGTKAEETTIAELLQLLESDNPKIQVGAIEALQALKAKTALPKLVRLLASPAPEVASAARAAIDVMKTP